MGSLHSKDKHICTMTTLPHFPPLDGSITVLPGFADFHAANNPHRPWVVFPSSQSPTNIVSISFLEFAKATHRVAHAIRPNRQGRDGEVVALLLNCDSILYLAIIAGIIRAGLTVCIDPSSCCFSLIDKPHYIAVSNLPPKLGRGCCTPCSED